MAIVHRCERAIIDGPRISASDIDTCTVGYARTWIEVVRVGGVCATSHDLARAIVDRCGWVIIGRSSIGTADTIACAIVISG